MTPRFLAAAICGLASVAITLSTPALAQKSVKAPVSNNASFGDWLVKCEAISTTNTACRLEQLQTRSETNALLARFIALPTVEGGVLLFAQVPAGVYLPAGAAIRPDVEGAEQRQMIWQTCIASLCEAAINLTKTDLDGLSDAGAMLFGYQPRKDDPPLAVRVDVSRLQEAANLLRD